jgi:hypothetical protein
MGLGLKPRPKKQKTNRRILRLYVSDLTNKAVWADAVFSEQLLQHADRSLTAVQL